MFSTEFYINFCLMTVEVAIGITLLMTLGCGTLRSKITKQCTFHDRKVLLYTVVYEMKNLN